MRLCACSAGKTQTILKSFINDDAESVGFTLEWQMHHAIPCPNRPCMWFFIFAAVRIIKIGEIEFCLYGWICIAETMYNANFVAKVIQSMRSLNIDVCFVAFHEYRDSISLQNSIYNIVPRALDIFIIIYTLILTLYGNV